MIRARNCTVDLVPIHLELPDGRLVREVVGKRVSVGELLAGRYGGRAGGMTPYLLIRAGRALHNVDRDTPLACYDIRMGDVIQIISQAEAQ